MPTCWGGDVFTAEPDVAGEESHHKAFVECILLEITSGIDDADGTTDTFRERTVEVEIILDARACDFSGGIIFGTPAAAADCNGGFDDHIMRKRTIAAAYGAIGNGFVCMCNATA